MSGLGKRKRVELQLWTELYREKRAGQPHLSELPVWKCEPGLFWVGGNHLDKGNCLT